MDYGKKSNAKKAMDVLPKSTQKTLREKALEHNEEYGKDPKRKLVNKNYLAVSYHRGIGAYNTNPSSVRPTVTSAEQWAYGRVNGFLYALRNLKFKRKPFDTDLLPKEHPYYNAEKSELNLSVLSGYQNLDLADKDEDWGFTPKVAEEILGDPPNIRNYAKAFLYVDENKRNDPKAYRIPIAKMVNGSLKIVFRGVAAAFSSLNGSDKHSSGYWDLSSVPNKEKDKLKLIIKSLYRKFNEEVPSFSGDDRAVGDKDPTNFPKKGDNKKVSLRNSEYPLFPLSYAKKLKEEHPDIWKLGGNIRGNDQYSILTKIQNEHNGVPQTPSQEAAIRRREAWMARHLKDFRIAGVIAQVKWLGIGSRGLSYMKNLIQDEIKKRENRSVRNYVDPSNIPDAHQMVIDKSTPEKYDVDYTYVPFPSDYETRKELLSVKEAMENKTLSLDFIRKADEDMVGLFIDTCLMLQLNIDNSLRSELDAIVDESSIAILKLKYLYNRERPFQLAKEMGEDFDVLSSVSAHTPSYPSGHTVQALLLAKKLSDVFPHRMRDFFRLANDISWSRIEAGYHFPSDIHYGEVIYKNMTGEPLRIINLLSHLNLLKTHNIISSVNEENDVKQKLEDILNVENDVKCHSMEIREDGKKVFRLEGRIRGELPIQALSSLGDDIELSEGSKKFSTIEGIASSTSVDTYGTEMSLTALKGMQEQILKGVPILPRHNSQYNSGVGEWDDVIGRTVSSKIIEVNTANPASRKEKQYILNVRSVLYNSEPKTAQLMERLKRSEPIGQSVGGWFEDVDVIEDRGEVERVIIKKVTLDHIAITRAPANPDSHNLVKLSILRDAISGYKNNSEENKTVTLDEALEIRKAMPYSSLPKAPADMEWDWNTEAQNDVLGDDNWERYAKAHLYMDENADKETKAAYKLPIAKMVNGRLHVVLRGVQAAMAALNGARGGVDIPDSDRIKIYDNIKRYYKLFEKEAPPLRSIGEKMENTDERMSMEEKERMLEEKERMLEEKERKLKELAEKERMLAEKERMLDEKAERLMKELAEEAEEDRMMEDEEEDRMMEDRMMEEEDRSVTSQKESDEKVSSVNNAVIETRNSATLSNGDNMTENDLGKIAALINNAVKPLNERMDALENTSTAKPVEKTEERSDISELQRKLEKAENLISRMMERPLRSGIHTSQTLKGPEARSYLERAIDGARADGSSVLARTAENAKEVLMEEKVPTHHDLVQILAAGIRAAEADGIINTESTSKLWK